MRKRSLSALAFLSVLAGQSAPSWAANTTIIQGLTGTTVPFLNAGKSTDNTTSSTGLAFQLNGTEYMRLTAAGSLGIGTTTPAVPLHIYNALNGGLSSFIQNTSSGTSAYSQTWLINDSGNGGGLFLNSSARSADGGVSTLTLRNDVGDLRLQSAGIVGMTVKGSTGNVGIGTTSPNAKLSIINNVATGYLDTYGEYQMLLYDSGNAAASYGLGIKGNTVVFNSGAGAYSFDSGGTATRMVIDTSGNVGIGTTSPAYNLDVTGTTRISGALTLGSTIACLQGNCPPGGVARLTPNLHLNSGAGYAVILNWDNGTTGTAQTLRVGNGASADSFYVQANGETHQTGNLYFTAANPVITSGSSYIQIPNGLYVSGGTPYFQTQIQARAGIHNDTGTYLAIDGGTAGNTYFSGNVGIGSASPQSKLHLAGSGLNLTMYNTDTTSNNSNMSTISTYSSATNMWSGLVLNASTLHLEQYGADRISYTTSGDVAIQPSSGNVGIGTTSPSYLLHVNGTAYAAGAAGALSDERHKKDVKTLALSGLETVGKLRPVSFLWKEPKDDGMKGEQLGFLAQEVEKILPQVVLTENNAEKTKGLKYTEIVPILTKAIQELKADNDELRAKVKAQQDQNDDLRARLEKIEARLK